MKPEAKNIIEIAGGILIGVLASEAVNKVVSITKKQVLKVKGKDA